MRRVLLALCLLVAAAAAKGQSDAWDWSRLTPEQQRVLAPWAKDWAAFAPQRRQKLAELAALHPADSVQYQRLQQNIQYWAALAEDDRLRALEQMRQFLRQPPEVQAAIIQQWKIYEQLPETQKQALREQARR